MCVRFFRRSMSESLFSNIVWLMVLSCRRGPWGLNAFYDSSLIQEQFSLTIYFWQSNSNSLFIYFMTTVNIRERPGDILRLGNTCVGCVLCVWVVHTTQSLLIINNVLIIKQNQQPKICEVSCRFCNIYTDIQILLKDVCSRVSLKR